MDGACHELFYNEVLKPWIYYSSYSICIYSSFTVLYIKLSNNNTRSKLKVQFILSPSIRRAHSSVSILDYPNNHSIYIAWVSSIRNRPRLRQGLVMVLYHFSTNKSTIPREFSTLRYISNFRLTHAYNDLFLCFLCSVFSLILIFATSE